MLTIDGQAMPSPASLTITNRIASGTREYATDGTALLCGIHFKRRVEMSFACLAGSAVTTLLTALGGDIVTLSWGEFGLSGRFYPESTALQPTPFGTNIRLILEEE